ncbi:MAG TPA: leucine-rich repeat protein [Candidatus Limnocylindria bacterium]|nr:leucine-rich repeat protein [Candidatus Limnocylindria bacterium]
MNKRAALPFIAAALLLALALGWAGGAQAAVGTTADGFVYSTLSGAATITGYTGKLSAITIPSSVAGVPVRTIGAGAFRDRRGITSVTVPSGVQGIGDSAFRGCTALATLNLPGSLAGIGPYAFYGCGSMRTLTLPTGLQSIGAWAFSAAGSLSSVSLPGTLTTLGECAFYACPSLLTVRIPGSVARISAQAFAECHSLSSVTILAGVTRIGDSAFEGCGSLQSVSIPGSVAVIEADAFYRCASLGRAAFPSGVTAIGARAFAGCISISSVSIPGTVSSIGESAFEGCYTISSVNIPQGVASIGARAFFGCRYMYNVTIAASVTSIGPDAFTNPPSTIYGYPGSYAHTYADVNGIPFKALVLGTPNMSGARWDYNAPFMYDGTQRTVTVTGLPAGVTVKAYEGNTAADIGSYHATVTLDYDAALYSAPALPALDWQIVAAAPSTARPAPKVTAIESVSATALKLTWDRVSGASGYEVWRSPSQAGPYTLAKKTAGLTWSSTYLTPGTQYFYKVRTYDTAFGVDYVSGRFGPAYTGVPIGKAALTAVTATGTTSLEVRWSAAPGAAAYQLQLAMAAGGPYKAVRTTAATSAAITGLKPGTGYWFKVLPYAKIGTLTYYGPLSGYRGGRTLAR